MYGLIFILTRVYILYSVEIYILKTWYIQILLLKQVDVSMLLTLLMYDIRM